MRPRQWQTGGYRNVVDQPQDVTAARCVVCGRVRKPLSADWRPTATTGSYYGGLVGWGVCIDAAGDLLSIRVAPHVASLQMVSMACLLEGRPVLCMAGAP